MDFYLTFEKFCQALGLKQSSVLTFTLERENRPNFDVTLTKRYMKVENFLGTCDVFPANLDGIDQLISFVKIVRDQDKIVAKF